MARRITKRVEDLEKSLSYSVFQALFIADEYPHLVTLLALSGLREGRPGEIKEGTEFDYAIRLSREEMSMFQHGPPLPEQLDSVVQLYTRVEHEAKWIPVVRRALRRRRPRG